MPINAPPYYYILAERYKEAKDIEEKEKILIEMIKVLPKHKGSDRELASLKRRLSLLRKEKTSPKVKYKPPSIKKIWPRVCLLGYGPDEISGFNLTKLGRVYHGVLSINKMHIQVIYMNDINKDKEIFDQSDIVIAKQRIDTEKTLFVMDKPDIEMALKNSGVIAVFTADSDDAIPMKDGDTVIDLAKKLHINLTKGAYAIVYGKDIKFQGQRVSVNYKIKDGDRVIIKV